MNNTYNYSFLADIKSSETTQHIAFEKGGTPIEEIQEKQEGNKITYLHSTPTPTIMPKRRYFHL